MSVSKTFSPITDCAHAQHLERLRSKGGGNMAIKPVSGDSAQRTRRLVRLYPMAWRERYVDEFEAHLEQESDDTPNSFHTHLNIIVIGGPLVLW
jgi:hypothetical protein